MGMTPLAGLMMGTRCGPLCGQLPEVQKSGLLGVSGVSSRKA